MFMLTHVKIDATTMPHFGTKHIDVNGKAKRLVKTP